MRDLLNQILADHTGQPVEKIHKDTDRDFVMEAAEAKEYGIIDEVISARELADNTGADHGRARSTARRNGGDDVAKFGDGGELLKCSLLRQVAEAGQEAHRRPGRLHLRRVHRPLQRDHRRGALRDLRAALRRAAQAA